MSNEVNISKMYQFIASFNKNGESWADVADGDHGNNDGTVIKSEFRAFVNAEFANWNGNEGGTVSNDIINQFWKKIDTNTTASKISGTKLKNLNALDNKELATLEKKLEVYVAFDEFIAANVKTPDVLTTTGAQWKNAVVSELSVLVEQFIQGGCKGDFNALLKEALPAIANQNTAEFCALEYQEILKNGVLAGYPEYDVTADSTLTALLAKFLSGVGADTTADQIKAEIRSIMDAYLATAGIGEGSEYDLGQLGFNNDAINGIQTAVITQNIKNDLAEEAKKYEGFENEFNAALQEFINSKLQEGVDFETLKGCANEFLDSKFKTKLDTIIEIQTTYKDVVESQDAESFYQKLKAEFGESLADRIAKNDRYIDAYKAIIEDVIAKVNANELTKDEIADYIINEISKNLEKFYGNNFSDMPISELNTTYDNLSAAADAQKDDDESLKQHREAAIKYCDALSKKSNVLKQAVIDAFKQYGSDYRTAINEMLPGDIKEVMALLKAEALKIGEAKDYTCNWTGIEELTIDVDSSQSTNINAKVNRGNGSITPPDSYEAVVKSGDGKAECLNNGVLTITAGKTVGVMTVEVYAIVDGQRVGEPKLITIQCQESVANIVSRVTGWNGAKSEHLEVAGDDNDGQQVTSIDFAKLYSSNAVITLHNGSEGDTELAWNRLGELGDHIVKALATAGLNEGVLKTAKNNVIKRYKDQGYKAYGYGKGHRDSDDMRASLKSHIDSNADARHTMVRVRKVGKYVYGVSFKDLVDDILAEYNKLAK